MAGFTLLYYQNDMHGWGLPHKNVPEKYTVTLFSLVPQWGLVCEECPLSLSAFWGANVVSG